MKLPIAFRTLVLSLTFVTATAARAQIVSSNPLEYAALIEGNELINAQIESQTKNQLKTAGLQSTMAAEFTQIKKKIIAYFFMSFQFYSFLFCREARVFFYTISTDGQYPEPVLVTIFFEYNVETSSYSLK